MAENHLRAIGAELLGKNGPPLSDGTARPPAAILHRIAPEQRRNVHGHPHRPGAMFMRSRLGRADGCGPPQAHMCGSVRRDILLAPRRLGRSGLRTAHGKLPFRPPRQRLILPGYDWHDDGVPGGKGHPHRCRDPCPCHRGSPNHSRPPGRCAVPGQARGCGYEGSAKNFCGSASSTKGPPRAVRDRTVWCAICLRH